MANEMLNMNLIREAGADAPDGKALPAVISEVGDQLVAAIGRLGTADAGNAADLVAEMTDMGMRLDIT